MKKLLLAVLALTLLSNTTYAEETYRFKDGVTVLQLSESATTKAEQDRLIATLRIEFKGDSPRIIQRKVNTLMNSAITITDRYKQLKVTTCNYNIRQNYYNSKSSNKPKWVASQTINIDSDDSEALLNTAGELQKRGLMLKGLNYYLSREKAATYKDDLIVDALVLVRKRANLIASKLGSSKVHFANINVSGNSSQPRMHRKEMMMANSMSADSAPVAKSGEQDVSVNISVTVELVD